MILIDDKYINVYNITIVLDKKLVKAITAYALKDFLQYKLGERLSGSEIDEEFDHFTDAIRYLSKRPTIRRQLAELTEEQMAKLLIALEDEIK